jgi:hypothetical protein
VIETIVTKLSSDSFREKVKAAVRTILKASEFAVVALIPAIIYHQTKRYETKISINNEKKC